MVLQILGAAALLAPSLMNIGSKTIKWSKRVPYGKQFAGAAAFGLGYGAFTNIGYNLSNSYLTSGFRPTKYFNSRNSYTLQMPYGRTYSRYSGRSYYPRRRMNRYRRPTYRRYSNYRRSY